MFLHTPWCWPWQEILPVCNSVCISTRQPNRVDRPSCSIAFNHITYIVLRGGFLFAPSPSQFGESKKSSREMARQKCHIWATIGTIMTVYMPLQSSPSRKSDRKHPAKKLVECSLKGPNARLILFWAEQDKICSFLAFRATTELIFLASWKVAFSAFDRPPSHVDSGCYGNKEA